MGVGLVRSLQPPDILWIHWRVYNSIANTSKGGTLLPPSDAYVRSFLYLLYTLIKLYYTKALSDPASSLAPDWIRLLRRPRIPRLIVQQQPFRLMAYLSIFKARSKVSANLSPFPLSHHLLPLLWSSLSASLSQEHCDLQIGGQLYNSE